MIKVKTKQAPPITWITMFALVLSMCASFTFSQRVAAQEKAESQPVSDRDARVQTDTQYPALTKYATDLTALALRGKLETVKGHEADVARVIASLATAGKAPVVVSESDLDRDAIARGVAIKVAFGDVPESLRNKKVFGLSLEALAKDAKTTTEFQARVQAVFAETEAAKGQIVLFIDQLHQYARTRATSVASATIKAAIETNHVQVIGGAAPEAYATYIAADEAVAKLFEPISIDHFAESASESTASKTRRKSPINEEFEGEKISSDMQQLIKSAGRNGHVKAIL